MIGNLLSGVFFIVFNMNSYECLVVFFIFLVVFFDLFDGKIVRKLKVNSVFGVELDFLVDIISFGVVFVMLFYIFFFYFWLIVFGFMIYLSMGVLRLVKFSVNLIIGYFIGFFIFFFVLIIVLFGMFYYVNFYFMIILVILMVSFI